MTVAYTRISTDKQDQINQEHRILQYCQTHGIQIDEFVRVEMSSRKSEEKRRIEELKERLREGDTLIVSELSRLGRKMIDVLNLLKWFGDRGVEVVFVNQPELSLVEGAMRDFMIAAYGYFAETEREFVSMRTRAGLEAAKAKGKKLGRPKGAKGKLKKLDPYRQQIVELIKIGLPVKSIQKFLNSTIEEEGKRIKYTTLKYYIDNHIIDSEWD